MINLGHSKSSEKELLKEKYLLLKGEYVKLLTDKDCLLEWGKPPVSIPSDEILSLECVVAGITKGYVPRR